MIDLTSIELKIGTVYTKTCEKEERKWKGNLQMKNHSSRGGQPIVVNWTDDRVWTYAKNNNSRNRRW